MLPPSTHRLRARPGALQDAAHTDADDDADAAAAAAAAAAQFSTENRLSPIRRQVRTQGRDRRCVAAAVGTTAPPAAAPYNSSLPPPLRETPP
jgi:hypothetical protein